MFLFYALPIGLLLGFVLGGRLSGLANLKFRWGALAVLGFAMQVVLFSGPVSERVGDAGPILYVASTALVFVTVLANLRTPGMALVAVGAASNLAAILANGGYMPASHAAAAVGPDGIVTYSNTKVIEAPALQPLTDVIALPAWLPFTNIASIGDLLIGAGIAIVIAASMRSARGNRDADLDEPGKPVLEVNSPF
jgi:Family of unknown function (DUF5317)